MKDAQQRGAGVVVEPRKIDLARCQRRTVPTLLEPDALLVFDDPHLASVARPQDDPVLVCVDPCRSRVPPVEDLAGRRISQRAIHVDEFSAVTEAEEVKAVVG